jgi:phosphoribosylglycinamide formyltransferase 1
VSRSAVFLDRDGTLIDDPGYLGDPDQLVFLPGAVAGARRLVQAGYELIVITNQSGIGRGHLTPVQVETVHEELQRQLRAADAPLRAILACPHAPDDGCLCRKPGTALHREAAARFDLDLDRSWYIGDRLTDLLPAHELGGRGVLVRTGHGASHQEAAVHAGFAVADDLAAAARRITDHREYRVAVAVSGRGSNLVALHEALAADPAIALALVVSDRDAPALRRAAERGVPVHRLVDYADADEWLQQLVAADIDLLVLAGYLRLVPAAVIAAMRHRVINIHPALLPAFGGEGMYGARVHAAVLAAGAAESGATVHLVDEVYDRGTVLAQGRVPVRADDSPESLAQRVLLVEHSLLPAAVRAAAAAGHPVAFAFE